MRRQINVSKICEALRLNFAGPDVTIDGLNLFNRTTTYHHLLTYSTSPKYIDVICNNHTIKCVVVNEKDYKIFSEKGNFTYILCEQAEKTFYDIHDYLYDQTDFYEKFNFPYAIGSNCNIHSTAVIEPGVTIGNNTIIGANTVIKKGTIIKSNCCIGCNSTIGSEGFQILRINGKNRRIRHCGGVLLNENTCIGDNVTICRSLFEGVTYIGKNVMIDNLSYIAHIVSIGDNAVITAGNMLCGSSVVEENAWIGVNSSLLNRVTVGCNCKIGMGSVITKDIPKEALAYGVPAKIKNNITK